MSAPKNARTAALEALIDAHAVELKLPTVRRRFRTLAEEAVREQQTPVAYLAALPEAEMAERAERREKRRLIDARFPRRIHVSPARRHNHAKRALYLPRGNTDQDPATTPCWLNLSTGSHHAPLSSGFGEDWSGCAWHLVALALGE